ncbi:hypothetical protein WEH80_35315 [Actinomycetes bacterium KLBMP 9759]
MPDDEELSSAGRMRFQDGSTTPREPTLAEQKAREQALRRQEEATRAQAAADEKSRKKRKRILIGAGVTVGLVAVIAVGYAVVQDDDDVDARCVEDDSELVVDDANCVTPAAQGVYSHGGSYPIFIGANGRQYHYHYGSNTPVGSRVSGGTTVVPRYGTKIKTLSGKTTVLGSGNTSYSSPSPSPGGTSAGTPDNSNVSRGGLGVSNSGSSGS